jgi:hypothetical protein
MRIAGARRYIDRDEKRSLDDTNAHSPLAYIAPANDAAVLDPRVSTPLFDSERIKSRKLGGQIHGFSFGSE